MYKITCFARIDEQTFAEYLRQKGFVLGKKGYELQLDGTFFRVRPFQNQARESFKGYRIFFTCDITSGSHLFNHVFRGIDNFVTGVEYIEKSPDIDWEKAVERFCERTGPGIYRMGKTGICIMNDTVVLLMRSKKGKRLALMRSLEEVDSIRKKIVSSDEYDLFSLPETNAM